jgi:hypothetical protein
MSGGADDHAAITGRRAGDPVPERRGPLGDAGRVGGNDVVYLLSVGVTLALADVYALIEFHAPSRHGVAFMRPSSAKSSAC